MKFKIGSYYYIKYKSAYWDDELIVKVISSTDSKNTTRKWLSKPVFCEPVLLIKGEKITEFDDASIIANTAVELSEESAKIVRLLYE